MAPQPPQARRDLKAVQPPGDLAGYHARLLAHGFDGYAETFNATILPEVWNDIEAARNRAAELDERGKAPAVSLIHGKQFAVMPHGAAGGVRFVLRDENVIIHLRSEKCEWGITLRYLSAALWSGGGLDARRADYAEWLDGITTPRDGWDGEPTLSRADYCFDFLAPSFTAEATEALRRRFLAPAHTQWSVYGRGERAETFTLGKLPRLQVQVYDKGTEIVRVSGKDWFRDVWKQSAEGLWPKGKPDLVSAAETLDTWHAAAPAIPSAGPLRDVWRIEIRLGWEYLDGRRIKGYRALRARLPEILGAALIDRRLTVEGPGRADLRAVHPMWWLAYQAAEASKTTLRAVYYSTQERDEYRADRVQQLAGTAISTAVSQSGEYDPAEARRLFADALRAAEENPELARKVEAARGRFLHLGVPH